MSIHINPEISIIVPVYNVEPYLEKCIDSILNQTFSDFELILVDDGSPDKCGMICDCYAEMDSRVKIIHKKNGGVSSARSAGLKIAKGEYIGFVDSDDYIERLMFESLYRQAIDSFSDIVVCDFNMLNESGEVLNEEQNQGEEFSAINYTNIQSLEALFITDQDTDFGTGLNPKWVLMWNKLYKRQLFSDIKLPTSYIYQGFEDERITHQLLYKSKRTTHIHKRLYNYLMRKDSLSNFRFSLNKLERVYALKQRVDFFKEKKLYELHYKALSNYMDIFFWNYFVAKTTLPNVGKELRQLKKTMNGSFLSFIKNPLINWKQKAFIALFIVYPNILVLTKRNELKSLKIRD